VDGKTSRPTHRDKAAMNGAQRRVVETKFMTGPPASVVDETIDHATSSQNLGDRTVYYDSKNDVTVVQSNTTGKIMSAHRGQ
jgi:hypothetical protein